MFLENRKQRPMRARTKRTNINLVFGTISFLNLVFISLLLCLSAQLCTSNAIASPPAHKTQIEEYDYGTLVEDEIYSGTRKCPDEMFQCLNLNCVPRTYLCDGSDDCGDQSDEFPTNGMCTNKGEDTHKRFKKSIYYAWLAKISVNLSLAKCNRKGNESKEAKRRRFE